jgi:hypothetical protein
MPAAASYDVTFTSHSGTTAPSAQLYVAELANIKWNSTWEVDCLPDSRRSDDAPWPARCALPCVQYSMYDEVYLDGAYFASPRTFCPCNGLTNEPYQMPFDVNVPRAVATRQALFDWWDSNIEPDHTSSRWTDAAWTAQGAWLGGSSLRDATWLEGSSYCSWPFLECTADCSSTHALGALDFRNASLYIPQLDFSAFATQLSEAERQDVWYL